MASWCTNLSVAECFTCGWQPEQCTPRQEAAEAVQHKRELPDHEVVISREQTRRVELKAEDHRG